MRSEEDDSLTIILDGDLLGDGPLNRHEWVLSDVVFEAEDVLPGGVKRRIKVRESRVQVADSVSSKVACQEPRHG